MRTDSYASLRQSQRKHLPKRHRSLLPGRAKTACRKTSSQFHRNISATLRFADEFSIGAFIDSPCEN
jgi:hypothetical protein